MSSTIQTSSKPSGEGGRQYVGFEEYIEYQLKLARRGIRGADLLTGCVGAVLLLVGYLFLFVVTDHWVVPGGWSQTARYLLWAGFLAGIGTWSWYKLIRPWTQRVTQLYAASQLEHSHPELKSNLLTLVDLQQAGRPVSPVIIEAMERRAAMNLQQVNVDDAVDRHTLTRLSYALLAMVVVLCLYTLVSPKSLMSSAWRALFPMTNVTLSTQTVIFEVKPGDITVMAHATPDIEATLSGAIPEEVRVLYTTADRRMVDEIVKLQDTGEGIHRFRGRLLGESGSGLLQNVTYRIEAGDAVSPTYSINVYQPPTATVQDVSYDYPNYMGLEDRTQTDSAIDAWEGTTVTVRATANVPVDSATILFFDTEDAALKAEEIPLLIKDGVYLSAQWQLRIRGDGTFARFYRIQLSRKSDPKPVDVPTLHTQRVRSDLPPKLDVLYPTGDVELPVNGALPVAYEASDPDFLLKSVVIRFEKDGELLPKQELLFDAPPFEAKTRGQYLLKLDQFAVEPGKTLTFWLEAKDNFEPFADRLGNLTRSTPRITITAIESVPPEQAQQEQDEQQKAADQKLDASEQNANPAEQEMNPEAQLQDPADPMAPDEKQPDEKPTDPMADNPPGEEPQPMPKDGDQPPPEQNNPENGDPQPGAADQPKGGQGPQKPPKNGQPQTGQPPMSEPPAGQPQPNTPREGQPQQNPPKNGSNPKGTAQPPQPSDGGPPPGQKQTQQPDPKAPENTPSPQNKAKPRGEKAAPDEALQKLLDRQKKRQEQGREPPSADASQGNDPQAGDSSTEKPSEPGGKSPKPKKATEPSKTPPDNGGTKEPGGENESPMPKKESATPSPEEPSTDAGDPMNTATGTQKPKSGAKNKPGSGTQKPKNAGTDQNPENESPEEQNTGDPMTPKPSSETGTRPDAAQPKTNGSKPGDDQKRPEDSTGADNLPMPETSESEPGDMPKDATKPTGPTGDKPPRTNRAAPDQPQPNKPPKKTDLPSDKPEEKPTKEPNESPMTDASTGEPMPENGPPMANAEKPVDDPAAKPKAAPNGPEKPGEKSGADQTPKGDAPMPETPPQPGKMPGEMPPTGDQPQPAEKPGQKEDGGSPKPMDEQRPGDAGQPADEPSQKPAAPGEEKSNTPTSPVGQSAPKPSSEGGPSGDAPSGSESQMPGDATPGDGSPSESGPASGEGDDSGGKPSGGNQKPGGPPKPGADGSGKPSGSRPSDKPPGEEAANGDQPPMNDEAAKPSMKPETGPKGQPNGVPQSPEKPKGQGAKDKPKSPVAPKQPGEKTPMSEGPMPGAEGTPSSEEGQPGGQQGGGGGSQKAEGTESESTPEAPPAEANPGSNPNAKKPGPKGNPQKPKEQGDPAAGDQGGDQSGGGGGAESGGPPSSQGSGGSSASEGPPGGPGAKGGPPQGGVNPEDSGTPEASGPLDSPEEAINLENQRKAAALALEQIQDELSRGESLQDLKDELGYSDEELENFLKQLDQNLNHADDATSKEALARRRQFEELLKGVNNAPEGEKKSGGDQERSATESTGSNRRPTPKKFESAEEAFRKRMQKGR